MTLNDRFREWPDLGTTWTFLAGEIRLSFFVIQPIHNIMDCILL